MSLHALLGKIDDAVATGSFIPPGEVLRWANELRAALAGGGEAVAQLTTYEDTNSFSARMHDVVHDLPPGTYNLYLRTAGAVQVTDERLEAAKAAYNRADRDWFETDPLPNESRHSYALRAALTAALNPGGSRE